MATPLIAQDQAAQPLLPQQPQVGINPPPSSIGFIGNSGVLQNNSVVSTPKKSVFTPTGSRWAPRGVEEQQRTISEINPTQTQTIGTNQYANDILGLGGGTLLQGERQSFANIKPMQFGSSFSSNEFGQQLQSRYAPVLNAYGKSGVGLVDQSKIEGARSKVLGIEQDAAAKNQQIQSDLGSQAAGLKSRYAAQAADLTRELDTVNQSLPQLEQDAGAQQVYAEGAHRESLVNDPRYASLMAAGDEAGAARFLQQGMLSAYQPQIDAVNKAKNRAYEIRRLLGMP